ncbi:MAG: hypothetical protein DGJ47_000153 [Rickettsiaceae bacterium]
MSKIITRFAPSPTGMLHIGNVRTALINYLYTKKHNGEFILRMDDTDLVRSKEEYKKAIIKDLAWLGISWDKSFKQSDRLSRYEEVKQSLIKQGRLYPCYETPEELEIKRKFQLANGKPPIYDRSALKLTEEQQKSYENSGRKPHYRFFIEDSDIIWEDEIKGTVKYKGQHLSDPVIIRADGSMTYMLCSTVDDADYGITNVIRGEDHVSNTAIQIQMFDAIGHPAPNFAHLSLVKTKDDKISKREGGFDIASMRDENNIEAMTINSFLALIGTSNYVHPHKTIDELVSKFDITTYSKSPTTYMPDELEQLNQKLITTLEYSEVKDELGNLGLTQVTKDFWEAVRPNLKKIIETKDWWEICYNPQKADNNLDQEVLDCASKNLPENINENTWKEWTKVISKETGKKGKALFMPLRLAITGVNNGPELKNLLPLLNREEILKRLISTLS